MLVQSWQEELKAYSYVDIERSLIPQNCESYLCGVIYGFDCSLLDQLAGVVKDG